MSYQLDLPEIRVNFKFTEPKLKHNPNKKTKFLPYTSTFDENKIKDFSLVLGEFLRLLEKKRTDENIIFDETLQKMLSRVYFEKEIDKESFISIVKSTYQKEDGKTYIFHPYIYLYLTSDTESKKIGQFLYDVLICEGKQKNSSLKIDYDASDVLSQLFIEVLTEPKPDEYRDEKPTYQGLMPFISKLFRDDLNWLLSSQTLFSLHAEKLLKYYYFFYVSQFALLCQRFLHAEEKQVQPVYFNLEWENTSGNRISYENGWKKIESPIAQLYSHINCLEFLNHKVNTNKVYFYDDINEKLKSLDNEERNKLLNDLEILINEYQQKLNDTNWDEFRYKDTYDDPVKRMINKLYRSIDYQFKVSSRKRNYIRYQERFVLFCQSNFIKVRGRLGKTLKLTPEYLLFITKIIIKDESKIRLKKLFEGFSDRGILFDRDTQNQIIKYFETINIIEKKSDSGDAIYVKSFL